MLGRLGLTTAYLLAVAACAGAGRTVIAPRPTTTAAARRAARGRGAAESLMPMDRRDNRRLVASAVRGMRVWLRRGYTRVASVRA